MLWMLYLTTTPINYPTSIVSSKGIYTSKRLQKQKNNNLQSSSNIIKHSIVLLGKSFIFLSRVLLHLQFLSCLRVIDYIFIFISNKNHCNRERIVFLFVLKTRVVLEWSNVALLKQECVEIAFTH